MSDGTCPRSAPSFFTALSTACAMSVSASFRSVGPLLVPPEAVASYPLPAADGRGSRVHVALGLRRPAPPCYYVN